jgi:hypothetical protein
VSFRRARATSERVVPSETPSAEATFAWLNPSMRFLDDVPRVGRLANERHGKRVDHALVSLDQAAERIVPTRDIVGRSGGGHQVGVGRWKCAVGGVDGVSHRSDSREGWSECQTVRALMLTLTKSIVAPRTLHGQEDIDVMT